MDLEDGPTDLNTLRVGFDRFRFDRPLKLVAELIEGWILSPRGEGAWIVPPGADPGEVAHDVETQAILWIPGWDCMIGHGDDLVEEPIMPP